MNAHALDGTLLACGHGKIILRRNGRLILRRQNVETTLEEGAGPYPEAALSPDGTRILALTHGGATLAMWDGNMTKGTLNFKSGNGTMICPGPLMIAVARTTGEVTLFNWQLKRMSRIPAPEWVASNKVEFVDWVDEKTLVITYGDEAVLTTLA